MRAFHSWRCHHVGPIQALILGGSRRACNCGAGHTPLIFFCFIFVLVTALAAWSIEAGWWVAEDDTPYGCTYLDMDPSKGSDYQLACVPGYFPEEQP